MMEIAELIDSAARLYKKLGGVGSPDARLVRGLIKCIQDQHAEIKRLKQRGKNEQA